MPKQIYKIQGFHGGINSNSDPRDLEEFQSPTLENCEIDSVGRLKTFGAFSSVDGSGDSRPVNNYGLHAMSSDKKIDGSESSETLIFNFNRHDNKIDIKDSSGWNTDKITLDGGSFTISGIAYPTSGNAANITHTSNTDIAVEQTIHGGTADANFPDNAYISAINSSTEFQLSTSTINSGSSQTVQARYEVKPVYYSSDGVLRVSDANFRASSKWFGHIENERFSTITNVNSGTTEWVSTTQALAKPTTGKCLISVPFEGDDTTGVNSANAEYINTANVSTTKLHITENGAVNLRVGLQNIYLALPVTESAIGVANESDDADDATANAQQNPFAFYDHTLRFQNSDGTAASDYISDTVTGDDIYSILDPDGCFALPFFITSGRQYDDFSEIRVSCGTDDSNRWIWHFTKGEVEPDCWNLLICSANKQQSETGSPPDWGNGFEFWKANVYRQTSGNIHASSPSYKVSRPLIMKPGGINGFQPGLYTFHYTWLYDEDNKQESLPYKFGDIDNEIISTCDGFVDSDDAVAQEGTANIGHIRLASGSSSSDDFYNDMSIAIIAGAAAGDTRRITDYDAAGHANGSKLAIVNSNFSAIPDATSEYVIFKTDQTTVMIDSSRTGSDAFVADNLIGRVIQNTTSGAEAFITDNDANTVTVGALLYGDDAHWDVSYASTTPYARTGDGYKIAKSNVNKINIVGDSVLFNFDTYCQPWGNLVDTSVTTDVGDNQVDKTSHGLTAGTPIRLFDLSNTLGISNNTVYYVSSQSLVDGSFRLSTTYANAIAGTSIAFTGSNDSGVKYQTYALNRRITGSRIYWKVEGNDNYFLAGELDFINDGFKWLPESDTMDYSFTTPSSTSTKPLSNTALIKGISPVAANLVDTYKNINGFGSDAKSLDAQYKTAVVQGRRVYIGNVKQNGKTYPDRILKSQVNKFDTFPENLGSVDVVVRDGEDIVKLETYADRILQFKEQSLYIINVSENVDFLEDTFRNKGVLYPHHVTKTDYGIAWFNKLGVYIYDGKSVTNILEKNGIQLISTDSSSNGWKAFLTESLYGFGIERTMIGYIASKRQIFISNAGRDILMYNLVYQAWTKGINKLTSERSYTNFALDSNQDLFHITSNDLDIDTWGTDSSTDGNFKYITPDIDFGEPGVDKKVYKVYVTYKSGGTTNVQVDYGVNGGTSFPYDFADGTNITSTELASTSGWAVAELKPDESSEATKIKSIQLRFQSDGSVPSTFEINDISIVYRMRRIK